MNFVKINPKNLSGNINIPPSKSLSHRGIIGAALSNGESNIGNLIFSDDIKVTWEGMEKLGAKIEKIDPRTLKIKGKYSKIEKNQIIDCKESGSTLRFLIPISLLYENKSTFIGRGKLVSRPLDIYYKIFDEQKIEYTNDDGNLPLSVQGLIKPGIFEMEGNISSQFLTGLMFTLPLLKEDSSIIITNELESKGYVDLTIDILSKFGVEIKNNDYKKFIIKGNQEYKNKDYDVEGDFSQAAFWIVGGILGEKVYSKNLNINSLQGDKIVMDLVEKMGGDIKVRDSSIVTTRSKTKGIIIDASECPDIIPVMTVLAALSEGQTNIVNASRLRIKESDRLKAISTELNKLGADVVELDDSLIINGKDSLTGGVVDSWNDHRIAMALAIASIKATGEVTITNSDCVNKSYPHFWEDFKSLGGDIHEFDMGE